MDSVEWLLGAEPNGGGKIRARHTDEAVAGFEIGAGRAEIMGRPPKGRTDLLGSPVRVARPAKGGQGGSLRRRGRSARKGPTSAQAWERNRRDKVGLGMPRVRTAGTVIQALSVGGYGSDGNDSRSVCWTTHAAGGSGATQSTAQDGDMEWSQLSSAQPHAQAIVGVGPRLEARYRP